MKKHYRIFDSVFIFYSFLKSLISDTIGNISSLPRSIATHSVAFESVENSWKFWMLNHKPTFANVVNTALVVVSML